VQGADDKLGLGVGVSIPVAGVLPGEVILQRRILRAQSGVGAQGVPERQECPGLRVPVLDDMQMMGAGLRAWPQEP
jgi:hypothetical protein